MDRARGIAPPPSGTVTFLFTDIEGSTSLWDSYPEAMGPALARHDHIVRGAVDANGGHVFAAAGDGFAAVFGRAADAISAALAAPRRCGHTSAPNTGPPTRASAHRSRCAHPASQLTE